ncbi:hypothetical protein ACFSJ3_08120 [Corallincola platygyrae]|uniref:Uncharacterized protein n=1 Tax=Corallincola platygyrae TaxID=1193278 RepID=A0ABW4XL19_9GAMM
MNEILVFLNESPLVFVVVVVFIGLFNLSLFYLFGKKAERMFQSVDLSNPKFREKGASGYSTKSALTRLGGARKVLDVIVTDTELCIKGIFPPFTYIGTKYDLTHRVPLSCIKSVAKAGSSTEIVFAGESGDRKIRLQLNNSAQFIRAVGG